jgi:hypothetical protein
VQRQLLLLGSHAGCCEIPATESRALPAAVFLSSRYHGHGLCSRLDLSELKLATRSELLPLRDNAHSLGNLEAPKCNPTRVYLCLNFLCQQRYFDSDLRDPNQMGQIGGRRCLRFSQQVFNILYARGVAECTPSVLCVDGVVLLVISVRTCQLFSTEKSV